MGRSHRKGKPQELSRASSVPGSELRNALLLTVSLAAFIAIMGRVQMSKMQHDVHAEGQSIRERLPKVQAAGVRDAAKDAAFHWRELLRKLPHDLQGLGMTKRQVQVGIGIVRQKSYLKMASELRLEARGLHAPRKMQCRPRIMRVRKSVESSPCPMLASRRMQAHPSIEGPEELMPTARR